jgi:DNA-directed RNA polymerase subunit RPC12/RpoP
MADIAEGLLFKDPEEEGIPVACPYCGGRVKYAGLGEYECEKCGRISYDNYGKVRSYIESHPGATINQVMAGTGVSKASIKQLIADDRIQRRPYVKGTDDDDII